MQNKSELCLWNRFTVEDKSPCARFQPKPLPSSGNRNKKSRKGPTLSYADAIEESLKGLSLDDESDEYDDPSDKWTDEKLNVKQLSARYSGTDVGEVTLRPCIYDRKIRIVAI